MQCCELTTELLLGFFHSKCLRSKHSVYFFFTVINKARKATDLAARPISVGVCIYTVYIYIYIYI